MMDDDFNYLPDEIPDSAMSADSGLNDEQGAIFETEFARDMRQLNEAAVSPAGMPLDDLAREVRKRAIDAKEKDSSALPVQTNPTSARSARFGQVATVASGNEVDSIFWEGEEIEAQAVVVALFNVGLSSNSTWPLAQDASAVPYSYRPYAIVRWGSGQGATAEAIVDVGRGTQIKLSASAVYVKLGMEAAPSGRAVGTMQLGATLGFRNSSSVAPVTRTRYIDNLGASGTSAIVVPLFASQLLPIGRSVLDAVKLDFRDTNGTVLYTYTLTAVQTQTTPLPISDDTYDILVTNQSGGSACSYRLIFELVL